MRKYSEFRNQHGITRKHLAGKIEGRDIYIKQNGQHFGEKEQNNNSKTQGFVELDVKCNSNLKAENRGSKIYKRRK